MQETIHHLFIFLLLSSLPRYSSEDHFQRYSDCAPADYSCGAATIKISYPFRLDGRRHDYCGYPGFDIACAAGRKYPMITVGGDGYNILATDYTNHFLTVVATNFSTESCPRQFHTTTMDPSMFLFSDRDQNLTVYLNCTYDDSTKPAMVDEIGCLSDNVTGYHSYYSMESRIMPELLKNCTATAVIPVSQTAADRLKNGRLGFEEVLHEGFALRWQAGKGWCSYCIDSGGVCGYDVNNPGDHTCYCPYGSVNGTCSFPENDNTKTIVIGVATGAGGLIALCCLGFFIYLRRKRKLRSSSAVLLYRSTSSEPSAKNDPELGGTNVHTQVFSYKQLQEATNNFDPSRELGDGGFGTVYKGKLQDGRTVAVKRLYENNYRRVEQFMNEIVILSRLRHQNLVTLYGCTSRQSRELLLVYEFVSNGTVADHLHGDRAQECMLTWPMRMSIAIETADALAYLHATEPQIIHRDVKTNNILLDNNFHVKVADFGLSRLFPVNATHVSTAPQGTPGYVDPEYHQCYQLTDKSDVYSFGVVLVELISSMPAVDISRHRNEINLANMAINKIQKSELDQLIDPALGYETDGEAKKMITMVAELAFRCLQGERDLRPSIKEVLEVLRAIEGGSRWEERAGEAGALGKDEPKLLSSPNSVTEKWASRSTTPNSSN